jgi:hypothetical protein
MAIGASQKKEYLDFIIELQTEAQKERQFAHFTFLYNGVAIVYTYTCLHYALSNRQPIKKHLMFFIIIIIIILRHPGPFRAFAFVQLFARI